MPRRYAKLAQMLRYEREELILNYIKNILKQKQLIKVLILAVVIFAGAIACLAKTKLKPVDYINWVSNPQNGLVKNTVIGNYSFSLQYRPMDMMLLKDIKDIKKIDKKQFKAQRKEYVGLYYFVLQITPLNTNVFPGLKENFKDKNVFEREIEYFSFGMQQDVKLVQGKDTLVCVSFTHERVFKHAPYYTFLIAFEEKEDKKPTDQTFLYIDRLLGVDTLRFSIKAQAISNIPKLKIKK